MIEQLLMDSIHTVTTQVFELKVVIFTLARSVNYGFG
jgi:hypothetical protein